ncbi:hypothetical protein LINPERPRIM_LOCUS6637 [Linum perenne]
MCRIGQWRSRCV